MITATDRPEVGLEDDVSEPTTLGPILVATDGTASAEAALRAASMLARHSGAEVVVLSVLEGLPLMAADYGMLIPPLDSDQTRRDGLQQRVDAQVNRLGADATAWKVELREEIRRPLPVSWRAQGAPHHRWPGTMSCSTGSSAVRQRFTRCA
jgi:hypothetical protein